MSLLRLRASDRLIAGAVLSALALVWLVLVGFDGVTAFAAEIDEVGQGDYAVTTAALYTLLTLPRRAYELFPTAAVIGCLLGLGSLAATSELTALRAVGLSKLRICAGAAATVAVLTGLMVLVGESIGPWGELRAQQVAARAKSPDVAATSWSGIWARDGDTFVNAKSGRVHGEGVRTTVELNNVRLYEFADHGRLRAITAAPRAERKMGKWTLFEARRSEFAEAAVNTQLHASYEWPSQLDASLLSLSLQRPRYMATRTLRENLDYLSANGLDLGEFEVAYWARWFYPLHAIALCFAALPFAFGALRSGGFGKRLFIGIVIGIGYLLLQRLIGDLASVYRMSQWFGNLLLPSVVAVAGAAYFRLRG